MKYKAYLIARDPKTLEQLAEVLIFEHEDRLRVEAVVESADKDHNYLATAIRAIHKSAIISSCVKYEM